MKKYFFIGTFLLTIITYFTWFSSENMEYPEIERNVSTYKLGPIPQTKDNQSNIHDSQDTGEVVLEKFKLTPSELQSYYDRNDIIEESTLSISGLSIDRQSFQVTQAENLPVVLNIPLPEGGSIKFNRHHVAFKNEKSFVWVGTRENIFESMQLSFYGEAIVGYIQTKTGYYEIRHLGSNKQIIRLVDTAVFPELINDVITEQEELENQ